MVFRLEPIPVDCYHAGTQAAILRCKGPSTLGEADRNIWYHALVVDAGKIPQIFFQKSRAASSFGQIASIKVAWRLGGSGDQQMLRPSATGCRWALRWFLRGPSTSGFWSQIYGLDSRSQKDCGWISNLPSGKRLHSYGKSKPPCYQWANPL